MATEKVPLGEGRGFASLPVGQPPEERAAQIAELVKSLPSPVPVQPAVQGYGGLTGMPVGSRGTIPPDQQLSVLEAEKARLSEENSGDFREAGATMLAEAAARGLGMKAVTGLSAVAGVASGVNYLLAGETPLDDYGLPIKLDEKGEPIVTRSLSGFGSAVGRGVLTPAVGEGVSRVWKGVKPYLGAAAGKVSDYSGYLARKAALQTEAGDVFTGAAVALDEKIETLTGRVKSPLTGGTIQKAHTDAKTKVVSDTLDNYNAAKKAGVADRMEGLLQQGERGSTAKIRQGAIGAGDTATWVEQRTSLQQVYDRVQRVFGGRYQEVFKDKLGIPLSHEDVMVLAQEAKTILSNAENFRELDGTTRGAIERLAQYAENAVPVNPKYVEKVAFYESSGLTKADAERAARQALGMPQGASEKPLTIGDLLSIKGTLGDAVNSGNMPVRNAAHQTYEAVRRTMAKYGAEAGAALDTEYTLWRNTFTPQRLNRLRHGVGAEEFGPIFKSKAFARLVHEAQSEEEMQMLRNVTTDYVRATGKTAKGLSPSQLMKLVPEQARMKLYGAAGSDEAITFVKATADQVDRVLAENPRLVVTHRAIWEETSQKILDAGAQDIKDATLAFLKKLGPHGKDFHTLVAKMDPHEAVQWMYENVHNPAIRDILHHRVTSDAVPAAKDVLGRAALKLSWTALPAIAYGWGNDQNTSSALKGGAIASGLIATMAGASLGYITMMENPVLRAKLAQYAQYATTKAGMAAVTKLFSRAAAIETLKTAQGVFEQMVSAEDPDVQLQPTPVPLPKPTQAQISQISEELKQNGEPRS